MLTHKINNIENLSIKLHRNKWDTEINGWKRNKIHNEDECIIYFVCLLLTKITKWKTWNKLINLMRKIAPSSSSFSICILCELKKECLLFFSNKIIISYKIVSLFSFFDFFFLMLFYMCLLWKVLLRLKSYICVSYTCKYTVKTSHPLFVFFILNHNQIQFSCDNTWYYVYKHIFTHTHTRISGFSFEFEFRNNFHTI